MTASIPFAGDDQSGKKIRWLENHSPLNSNFLHNYLL